MSTTKQDFFLSCKKCILENPRNFYGCFSLGPFKNNQTLTVANALRRTLLTEISGIAITFVEIDGILHEYSILEGVRESILDILLNFKQIVLKTSKPLTKPVYGYLKVRGPGIIRVSDFHFPPNIQCVDPDQYIATLNENGCLSLKFTISDSRTSVKKQEFEKNFLNLQTLQSSENSNFENFLETKNHLFSQPPASNSIQFSLSDELDSRSKTRDGLVKESTANSVNWNKVNKWFNIYSSGSENKNLKKRKNLLWVDPLFNSVFKVNYLIETIEPIQKNKPNQILQIELWTNGSIHPRQALYTALNFLRNMFEKLDEMQYLNLQSQNFFFESEKTHSKLFKSFEYDFQFYHLLKSNKQKTVPTSKNTSKSFDSQNKLPHSLPLQKPEQFSTFDTKTILIEQLNLPVRITQVLLKNNFFTTQDLINKTPQELKKFCGFGNFSIQLIQKKLKTIGLKLKSV